MKKKNLGIWMFIGILVLVVLVFFISKSPSEINSGSNDAKKLETISSAGKVWIETGLKDVRTGETFKVSDFIGKPILLESFAVWCPTCTTQQKRIKELHEELGDSFVSISLDTDPNEDEARIQEHIERNGFDWYYAISPIESTEALIDDFGLGIVNAPAAPVLLICPDGEARKLDSGLKGVEELKSELNTC